MLYEGGWAQAYSQCPTCLPLADIHERIEKIAAYCLTKEQFDLVFDEEYWDKIKIKKARKDPNE